MNDMIGEMLKKYDAVTLEQKKNAVKEIVQEIVLCGLARARFFDKAAFYGGTALRIFYGLDRFSEDLDFSLKIPDLDFDLSSYFPVLEKEIRSFGLHMRIEEKDKAQKSSVKSAFVKGDTKEHMLYFYSGESFSSGIPNGELLKIKFEVDTNPPPFAGYEHRFALLPSPYEANLYDLPSLFAGKIHAVLCRGWKNRVKGRDLYDYVFYLQKGATVNLPHLKARLVQSGSFDPDKELTIEELKRLLEKRFDVIDFEIAKKDVADFIRDQDSLNVWSKEFFDSITSILK